MTTALPAAKESLFGLGLAVAMAWAGGALPAQETPTPGTPSSGQEAAQAAQDQQQSEGQRRKAEDAVKQAQQQAQQATEQFGARYGFQPRLAGVVHRRPPGTGTLVILNSDADPKEQANLEEDLAVMSHILNKTFEEKVGADQARGTAMGIAVALGSGSISFRSLYLEGYGAVFFINAGFPLLPPPAKPEAQHEKPAADSAWDQARQELYGHRTGELTGEWDAWDQPVSAPAPEYSQTKVDNLKEAILGALRESANIRGLKSEDSVTVCVIGGAKDGVALFKRSPDFAPFGGSLYGAGSSSGTGMGTFSSSAGGGASPGTIMTIRVKKSDAEAFAKGKITLDEFRKRARLATYVAGPGSPADGLFGGGTFGRGGFGGGSGGGGGGIGAGGGRGGFGGEASSIVPGKAKTSRLVQDGKLIYEMNKLVEAETALKQAIKDDPQNQTAEYYLKLVAEAQRNQKPAP